MLVVVACWWLWRVGGRGVLVLLAPVFDVLFQCSLRCFVTLSCKLVAVSNPVHCSSLQMHLIMFIDECRFRARCCAVSSVVVGLSMWWMLCLC